MRRASVADSRRPEKPIDFKTFLSSNLGALRPQNPILAFPGPRASCLSLLTYNLVQG